MEILGIYNKHSNLICHGKNIFDVTDKYLDRFPCEYRSNYDINLSSLKLFKVDEIIDDKAAASYYAKTNTIIFTKEYALGHDMFHVAGADRKNKIESLHNRLQIEDAMIEGMTEYFHMKAYNLNEATAYFFETFCVQMLEDMPEIFKAYFMPAESDFCELFPDSKNAYSLLYALSIYYEKHFNYIDSVIDNKKDVEAKLLLTRVIKEVLNDLVTIELSFNKSKGELNQYGDKFLDLLKSNHMHRTLNIIYPEYKEYAEEIIKKRVRVRGE